MNERIQNGVREYSRYSAVCIPWALFYLKAPAEQGLSNKNVLIKARSAIMT
jgi:hypothetical protein